MQRWRASSLFQPSNLAAAITATLDPAPGEPSHLFGAIMSFPHTVVARTVAVLGHDFIMVDAQHTAINAENLVQIIQTINLASEGKTIAVVRIATPDSELLTHALDAGAGGIIFAHVDTAHQAAECVAKTKYAYSGGDRSCSPSALTAGATDMAPSGTSHYRVSDEHIAVICQIESTLALENLDTIAATQGVTSLMLGPTDLRVSMGLPARLFGQHDEPRFLEAIDQLLRVSQEYRKPLMCVAFKVEAKSDGWINKFQLLITSADMASVVKSHRQDLANAKEMVAAYKKLGNGQISTNGSDKENSMNGYTKH